MDEKNLDEIVPAESDQLQNANKTDYEEDYNYANNYNTDLLCFNMKRRMITSGQNIPACNIGDVNIAGTPKNVHLGTKLIINGPLSVPETDDYDIDPEEDNLNNNEKDVGVEDTHTRIKHLNMGLDLLRKKGYIVLNRYFQVFVLFILIEVLIFISYSIITKGEDTPASNEIVGLRIKQIGQGLSNYESRETKWGTDSLCTVNCPLKRKSKLKFVFPKSVLFRCTIFSGLGCTEEFEIDYKSYRVSANQFNDIFYNYIIGLDGKIYEARPLTCSFTEHSLKDSYYDETLVLGISYCFPTKSSLNLLKTDNELKAINSLIINLQKNGIVNNIQELEFPKFCEGTPMVDKIGNKFNIKPGFDERDYNNITTEVNRTVINHMLLGSKVKLPDNLISITHNGSLLKPLQSEIDSCSNNSLVSTKVENVTIRFFYNDQLNITLSTACENGENFAACTRNLENPIKFHSKKFYDFKINYLALAPATGHILEIFPLNCSAYWGNHNSIAINVLFYLPPNYSKEPNLYFSSLARLIQPIKKVINDNLNYDKLFIEGFCKTDDKQASDKNKGFNYYEFLTNVSYVESDVNGNIQSIKECGSSPLFILSQRG